MLTIRLIKIGKKNYPSFRVILTEKRTPPQGGKFLEILGNYNPRKKQLNLKKERIEYWLSRGAQSSDTVHNLLVSQGIIKGKKIKKKLKIKKKAEETSRQTAKEEVKEGAEEKKEETQAEPIKEQAEAMKEEKAEKKREEAKETKKEKLEENKEEKPAKEKTEDVERT